MSVLTKLPKKYTWWHERERIGIIEHDGDINYAVSPTEVSAGQKMRIFVNRRVGDFTTDNLNQVSELPPEFHEALAYKVISMGYTRGQNINLPLAQYFEGMYRDAIKKAKHYAKQRKISTGRIKPVDF
tara:strand:- start:2797 stop:3180 length:384 start_codon:yes stop_codon:yes gene_type:complete